MSDASAAPPAPGAALLSLKPFVPSGRDYARSKQFFLDLGFTCAWENGGCAELRLGGAAFILQDFHHDDMQRNFMIFVRVADLDAWWEHVRTTGVLERHPGTAAKPPTLFPWGQREVHLVDPAGVCWHFG